MMKKDDKGPVLYEVLDGKRVKNELYHRHEYNKLTER